MGNSKLLKLAVSGVTVAAIAIAIGVGVGVHNKKIKEAASAANLADCRRLLVVPGVYIEDNVGDAPPTRRKLLARTLGDTIASYENYDVWNGDAYPSPAASITQSTSKGLKGTYSLYASTSTAGTKAPKGSKYTLGVSDSTKGPKGSKTTSGLVGSTKSKKGTSGLTDSKSPKGPKGSTAIPVSVIGYMFCIQHLYLRSCFSDSFSHVAHIIGLLLSHNRQMQVWSVFNYW